MKIVNINILKSRVNGKNEIKSMYINTLLAEKNNIASYVSHEIKLYYERENFSLNTIIKQFCILVPQQTEFLHFLKIVEENDKEYRRLINGIVG